MAKKQKKSPLYIEVTRAAIIVALSSSLGLVVNALSGKSLAVFGPVPAQPGSDQPSGGAAQTTVPHISFDELATVWKRNDPVLIVDVRGQAEYDIGHVPESLHAPLDSILSNKRDVIATLEGASKAGAMIVTLCDSEQCQKADEAADALTKLGYKNVRVLHGGWEAYFHSGAKVEEGAPR